MKAFFRIFAFILIFGSIVVAGFRSYVNREEKRAEALIRREVDVIPVVQPYVVKKGAIKMTIPVTGEVRALHEVDIIPKIAGRLERLRLPDGVLLDVGVLAKRGEEIAVIDHAALEAAVNQTQAAIEVAKASLVRAMVNQEDAEREKKRWEDLYAKGAASEDNRDKATTAHKRALADVALCQSQIKQAEAALRHAEVNLAEAVITSPISGVVSFKYVDEGSMVGPQTPLVRISQLDTVRIIGRISERHVGKIDTGKTRVRIFNDAYPDEELEGTIYRLGVDVDSRARTLDVETRISNPDLKLKPGMFARMMIDVKESENATIIPDSALVRREDGNYVYRIVESRVRLVPVVLGLSEGDNHEVLDGLNPGDAIVIRGSSALQDGMRIEEREEET